VTAGPRWLDKADVIILHQYVLDRTGGAPGLRDEGLLESALSRPLNRWIYEALEDARDLAATYGVAVAKNHPFVDGNKRAAFLALGLFLELNGWILSATNENATRTMLGVASGEIDEETLANWIRANSTAS
jgi:death-on-curing protein